MIQGVTIGDGTAPKGWPSYAAVYREDRIVGVRCKFNGCDHVGSLSSPSRMTCNGLDCECTCCQFLAGKKVHGLTYGAGK